MDMNEETKNKEGGAVCKFFCKNPIIYFVVTAIINLGNNGFLIRV